MDDIKISTHAKKRINERFNGKLSREAMIAIQAAKKKHSRVDKNKIVSSSGLSSVVIAKNKKDKKFTLVTAWRNGS